MVGRSLISLRWPSLPSLLWKAWIYRPLPKQVVLLLRELSGLEIPSLSSRNEEAAREKIELLKQKTLANASALGPLLKRMRDCIPRIDTVNSSKDSIHPVFKA